MKKPADPPIFQPEDQTGAPIKGVARLLRGFLEAVTGIDEIAKKRFDDESLCRRCGTCCHAAIRVKDHMVLLQDLPCKHLRRLPDGKAICAIYQLREMTGWCHQTTVESIRKELYPPDCPYVETLPHYKGKVTLAKAEFEEVLPILRSVFKGWPKPEYVNKSDWERFIHRTLGL